MRKFSFIFFICAGVVLSFLVSCNKDNNIFNSDSSIVKVDKRGSSNYYMCPSNMIDTMGNPLSSRITNSISNATLINNILDELYISGGLQWSDEEIESFGTLEEEIALYFSGDGLEQVQLPVYDQAEGRVKAFFKIDKKYSSYSIQFIDRRINNKGLAESPTNPFLKNNQKSFEIFDYATCNIDVFPEILNDDLAELSLCITAITQITYQDEVPCYLEDPCCICMTPYEVTYVTYGICDDNGSGNGSGNGGGSGGTGGSTGGSNSSTSNTVTRANTMHNNLLYYYPEYATYFNSLGLTFPEYVSTIGLSGTMYGTYLELANAFLTVKEKTANSPTIGPVVAWLFKVIAKSFVGGVVDFALQVAMEYWMGDHPSWSAAWDALDVNEIQILSSAAEANIKNKYVSIGTSVFSDLTNYLISTPAEQINAEDVESRMALAALSGYIGNNAGEYVGKIGEYMVKYGPQKPFAKLKELNIAPFFFELKSFREVVIEKVWANPSWLGRGRALEEIMTYSRYKGMTWLNAAGETGGPLDYLAGNLGIQLKTIQAVVNWSHFKSKVKGGLDQLVSAKNSGQCANGRLDVMMPMSLSGNFTQWKADLIEQLGVNDPNSIYFGLDIVIGAFIE